ncbi:hypothetical protein NKH18_01010 [Streptomyces sp. M10(2022)]
MTLKGLEAASYEMQRPITEMGSTARGAGSSGASHPMAVNETVIAMLRPKPNMARLADDLSEVRAAAQAVVDAPAGVGTIASYWTEVPLPATGTWNAPGKGGAQADVVLTAPQDGWRCCSSRSTTATRPRRSSPTSWRSTPGSCGGR